MSDAAGPRLYARERAQLAEVASLLGEGRRVTAFVVGDAAPRAAALATLREKSGVAIPDPVLLVEPWQALDALVEAGAAKRTDVRSFLIDHRAPHVLETLNWHRERLRTGASVLLWIDGIEGLRALRELGKDAYAFRDLMIVVEGERPVPVVLPVEETVELQLAKIPYEAADNPVDRAAAAVALGLAMHPHAPPDALRDLALDALGGVPPAPYDGEHVKTVRAGLYELLVLHALSKGEYACALRWARRGAAETIAASEVEGRARRVFLLILPTSPLNVDLGDVEIAANEILPSDPPFMLGQVRYTAAGRLASRGALREAFLALDEAARCLSRPYEAALLEHARAEIKLAMGDIPGAEAHAASSISLRIDGGNSTLDPSFALAKCLGQRGELEAAVRLLEELVKIPAQDMTPGNASREVAAVRVAVGKVPRALAHLRTLLHDAASHRSDRHLYKTSASYTYALRAAHEASRLTPADLTDADAELDVAEDVALSIARDDPPWYTILFHALRAEVLSLRPDRLPEAIALTKAAVDRARALWPDAAPMHARMLVAHLVRAGRLDEAREALAVAEPEAEADRHLRELARLRAHAVAVLVRTAAPADAIDAKLAALRATLDETGAPRIAADTLLELAQLLPRTSSHPDPLALLDEAATLFADMPIPAQEARCLEAMGDVLAARGDLAAARARYLEAKGTCERFGLGLRVPLLEAKLAR